ncbi:hypothetical protein J6590_096813, partial [Homalodisca vitripennis]
TCHAPLDHLCQHINPNIGEPNKPLVQIFTGAYFTPMPQTLPYISSIPIIYKIPFNTQQNLPKNEPSLNFCPKNLNNSQTYCKIQNNLSTLQTLIHQQMVAEQLPFIQRQQPDRNRRSLTFVRDFFEWCCDIATEHQIHDLVDNEKEITQHTNALIDTVDTDHQDLLLTTNNIKNFSDGVSILADKVHSSLKIMEEQIELISKNSTPNNLKQTYALAQQTWSYIYYNYYHDNMREIRRSCLANTLPEFLIPKSNLTSDLKNLNILTQPRNLTLAIPITKLSLYYTLKITTCTITQQYILIKIKVPLKQSTLTYKVFQNIPIPLHWQDKLCYITHEKSIVIRTQEFTTAIHPEDKGCNQNTLPLCLIPRATVNGDQSLRCLHSILNTSTLPTLRATCVFTCFNETPMPLVTQVSPNKFLVTNIQTNLKVVCSHQKTHHYIQKPNNTGTLEIILPCECSLHQENLTLINTVIPCGSKNPDNYKITHLLPISWSKFQSITILPLESETRQEFQHLHEILDENWTLSTPTYFVHNLQRQHHFQLKHDDKNIVNNTELILYILLAWTSIIALLLFIALYFIHINNIKIKFLKPTVHERDYPMDNLN